MTERERANLIALNLLYGDQGEEAIVSRETLQEAEKAGPGLLRVLVREMGRLQKEVARLEVSDLAKENYRFGQENARLSRQVTELLETQRALRREIEALHDRVAELTTNDDPWDGEE